METSIIMQDNTNDIAEFPVIRSKIYEIRGQKVMLDFDLAEIYELETKQLKRSVRRNIERFEGNDFMFELTKEETENLRYHFGTSSWGGTRYIPFAFTELGVAMLSSVLNSGKAIKVNKEIMRTFVLLRKYALEYTEIKRELENYMKKTDSELENIYEVLDVLTEHKKELEKPSNPIGFRTIALKSNS